jgi:hypothetical protein
MLSVSTSWERTGQLYGIEHREHLAKCGNVGTYDRGMLAGAIIIIIIIIIINKIQTNKNKNILTADPKFNSVKTYFKYRVKLYTGKNLF